MDPRTARCSPRPGTTPAAHRARQFGPDWFDHDLILAMDAANHADVLAELPADRHDRVRLFRSYDPAVADSGDVPDVPDPWYGGPEGFAEVLAIVRAHGPRTRRRSPPARLSALLWSGSTEHGREDGIHGPDADPR